MKPKRKPTTDTTTKGTDAMAYEIRNDHLPPAEQKAAEERRAKTKPIQMNVDVEGLSDTERSELLTLLAKSGFTLYLTPVERPDEWLYQAAAEVAELERGKASL